ncbi:MAG: PPOX class F420-dependent oxidoreductase [Chloroflexota bacterium]|nr:PPOX class F420-dependent oxidoreductase [Chloroflexota bacterium]
MESLPATLSPAARGLIESDALAHVVTIDADGTPHVSMAWIGFEHDEIVFGTLGDQRKLRNLRRDPRITISIEGTQTNEWGLRQYLVLSGTARVIEGGAPQLLQRLAHTYLGPGVIFPAMPNPPPGYVTRMRVQRVSGIGPWR